VVDKLDKVLLYYNPSAGNGVFKNNLDRVVERFQKKKMLVTPVRADRRDVLDRFFSRVNMTGYKKIIAAGGDGTINTAVNAMIKHDLHLPLSIFPSGTANDLAHYFDMPDSIEDMLDIALEDRYTPMDVGVVNGRAFVNVLAMGMLVDVSQKTDPNIKNTLGIMSYYLRGVAEVPKLKPITIRITADDQKIETKMFAMLIMNGRSAGGFKRIAPDAVINDGLLDVIIFESMPIANLAPLLLGVLTGQHTEHKNVRYFRTKRLYIESETDVSTDVDGETGEKLPLDVRVLPGRLSVNTMKENQEGNIW
jgi:YegS/Rv2252/BmrU family lipid kinase